MRYLGSKTLLLESILNITRSYSEGGVFCDPFGGIGTVGSYMKKNGYQILSGDILHFAHCFQVALIVQNQSFFCGNLEEEYGIGSEEELNGYFNRLKPKGGWLVRGYARERQFFTVENAMCIQACIDCIWEWKNRKMIDEEQYSILIASLIHCMDKVANTAGTYYAYLKHYYRKALGKFRFQVLKPVSGSERNRALLMDAGELVRKNEYDILYLDPPYNARNYGRYYHLPENIAMLRIPEPVGRSGMSVLRSEMSDYNNKGKAAGAFRQLIENARAGCIIFHYTDKGLIDMETAKEILREKGQLEEFYFDCKGYNTMSSSEPSQHHVIKVTL
jgi:adenine-specific DNA-methyltransferase